MIEFVSTFFTCLWFLFCVYALSRDDFSLFRKNVSLEKMFSVSILILICGLIAARFTSFLLIGGSGLLISGGVIGACIFTMWYTRLQKLPTGRIADIVSVSFLLGLSFGQTLSIFLTKKLVVVFDYLGPILFFVTFFVLLRLFKKNTLPEGVISILSLTVFSAVSLFIQLFKAGTSGEFVIGKEEVLLIIIFFFSLLLLVRLERFFLKRIS